MRSGYKYHDTLETGSTRSLFEPQTGVRLCMGIHSIRVRTTCCSYERYWALTTGNGLVGPEHRIEPNWNSEPVPIENVLARNAKVSI